MNGHAEAVAALIAAKADLEARDKVRGAEGERGPERWGGVRVGSMPLGEVPPWLRARMTRTVGKRERDESEWRADSVSLSYSLSLTLTHSFFVFFCMYIYI